MLRTLVTGALYNIINIVVQVLLGLIVFREMLLNFGEADFGAWSLLFAILAHIKLCEFGLGSMLSKLVPLLKLGDREQNKAYFSTAFYFMLYIFVFFLVVITLTAVFIDPTTLSFESSAPFGLVLFLLGCNFLFLFQTGSLHAYLTGNFKVGRLNSVRLFINVFRAFLIIWLLQMDFSVLAIAYVFAGTACLEFLLLLALSIHVGLLKDLDYKLCSVASFKYVIDRGYKLFFLSLNGYTRKNAPIIVCGFVLGAVAIVPLRIAGRLMEIYVEIATALNYMLTPYFSSIALSDSSVLNRNFLMSIVSASVLSMFIFLNIFYVGDWFLVLWLTDVPEYTSEILQLIAIGFCIANMQGPCTSLLISRDKNKTIMFLSIVEIAILMISIIPAINEFGLIGAAYALVASLLFSRALLQPLLVCNVLNMPYLKYLVNLAVPAFATFMVIYTTHIFVQSLGLDNKNLSVLIFASLQGAILGVISVIIYTQKKRRLNKANLQK